MTDLGPLERGKGGRLIWTEAHDAAIRHVYRPDRAFGEVKKLARHWGIGATTLTFRAKALGVRVEQYTYRMTEQQQNRIRAVYEQRKPSGNKILALEMGVPPRVISREAAKMGLPSLLPTTRGQNRQWRDDIELHIVRRNLHESIPRIRQILARKGYQRTYSQIRSVIARKRTAGIWPAFSEAQEAADLLIVAQISAGLGASVGVVQQWIQRGLLRAQSGVRARWLVKRKDLRAFMYQYRAHWRPYLRAADQDFLLDVLDPSTDAVKDEDHSFDKRKNTIEP